MTQSQMPKMKTRRSAFKRFKMTASGKLRRKHAFHSHILGPKRPKRKRRLVGDAFVAERDERRILGQLPYLQHL